MRATYDGTLKDLGRESPRDFFTTFCPGRGVNMRGRCSTPPTVLG
jgi:hypothetical protein